MRRKIKKDKIFILLSIIFIASLFIIYTSRFIYFYTKEANALEESTEVIEPIAIYDHLLTYLPNNEDSLSTHTTNLYQTEGKEEYYFNGQVENNFVYYSGRYWRIIKLNEDKTITLVSEETQTLLPYGEEEKYSKSYIYNYLNNVDKYSLFYNNLNNTEEILTNTTYCIDKVNDVNNVTCNETNNQYQISLLNIKDYINSGANDGFLNNGTYFWLMDFNETDELYYVFDKGGINKTKEYSTHHYGVRPVITIKGDILIYGGDGTLENPYYIDEYEDYKLTNVGVGEYLEYSGYTWRIISKDKTSVKVIMEDYIKQEDDNIRKSFSSKDNTYNINKDNNIGYYLNNEFYESLEYKEYLVKGKFYTGKYTVDSYDYRKVYEDDIEAYVGLPQIGDLYINTNNDSLTMLAIEDHMNNILYIINDNNSLYTSKITEESQIRPTLYLDGSLIALSGEGSKESPYIIGR